MKNIKSLFFYYENCNYILKVFFHGENEKNKVVDKMRKKDKKVRRGRYYLPKKPWTLLYKKICGLKEIKKMKI